MPSSDHFAIPGELTDPSHFAEIKDLPRGCDEELALFIPVQGHDQNWLNDCGGNAVL